MEYPYLSNDAWHLCNLQCTFGLKTLQVIHHLLSFVAAAYSMVSGEGQLYAYMVLISETTTPAVNLRW